MRLREWKDSNGKKVSTTSGSTSSTKLSGGSTKRFGKLLNYHIAHKDKDVDKIVQKEINPYGFTYAEHHTDGIGGYTKKIHALMNARGDWTFSVFSDGKEVDRKNGKGWDTFVWEISFYLALPPITSDPEYQDLLEWVDAKGQKVSHSTSSASQPGSSSPKNYPSQEDRYKRLLAQIDADKICKYTVNLLDDRILAFTLTNGVGVKIIFKPYVPCYLVQVDGYDTTCKDYEDVLKLLIIEGIITDTELCESTSIADDFKLYENLWD